jgi:hypothetical protein
MNLTGIGKLWLDGLEVSGPLRYAVRVEQRGFMTRASGHIMIERHDAARIIERIDPNSDLVLVLEDGRRWPCALKSTDGDLAGRGEIR